MLSTYISTYASIKSVYQTQTVDSNGRLVQRPWDIHQFFKYQLYKVDTYINHLLVCTRSVPFNGVSITKIVYT